MRKASNVFRWLAVGFLAFFLKDLIRLATMVLIALIPVLGWALAIMWIFMFILLLPLWLLSIFSYTISIITLIKLAKGKHTIALTVILTATAVLVGALPLILGAIFALISAILKSSADKKETAQASEVYTEEEYYTVEQ